MCRVRRPSVALVPLVVLSCGLTMLACGASSPSTPSGPTPPVTPSPQPPSNVVINGRLTSTVDGSPLGGVTVELAGRPATTSDDGAFRYEVAPGSLVTEPWLKVSGASILLDRWVHLSVTGSRDVAVNAIPLNSSFDLTYYRQLVRDDYDKPGVLRSLRRWTQAPRLYVRTIDEAGKPIEAATLDPVVAAFQDEAAAWTGGRFGLAAVELGTETREGVSGWITVKWVAPLTDEALCGRAQIATNGGWIELNYLKRTGCACRGSRIGASTVRHELGHAMGFYHTSDKNDVMWGIAACDDLRPSARERLHAAIAYSRPVGNYEPDVDPATTLQSRDPPIVIVD